ncbi:hypothetical protein ACFFRR_005671 [Megaselia abdita]
MQNAEMQQSHYDKIGSLNDGSYMKPLPSSLSNIYVESSIMYKRSYSFKNENYLTDLHNDWTEIENKNEWKIYPTRIPKNLQYYKGSFEEPNFDDYHVDNDEPKYIDKYLFEDIPNNTEAPIVQNIQQRNSDLETVSAEDVTYDCCSLWSIDESFCSCENASIKQQDSINSTSKTLDENANTKDECHEQKDIDEPDLKEISSSTENSSCQSEIASPIFEVISSSNNKGDFYLELEKSCPKHEAENNDIDGEPDKEDLAVLDKNENNTDDSVFVENKRASSSENINFNEFDIESENAQSLVLPNIIENNGDESKSSKVKILCQEIITEATSDTQNVLLLPVKTIDIEKDSTNLVGETKHISEFLCNEVYLNSQLINDLSIFTDNSNFNRENNIASPLPSTSNKILSESEKTVEISDSSFKPTKLPQLKPSKSTNNKKSILKGKYREDTVNLPTQVKLKRIKKKVSFDEAELVNNVKKRIIFTNNEDKIINKVLGKKKSNKRVPADQLYITTVAMKKINYKCDIKSKDEDRYTSNLLDINRRKKKKKSGDDRRKKRIDLIDSKRNKTESYANKKYNNADSSLPQNKDNQRVPQDKNPLFENSEIFLEENNIFSRGGSRRSSIDSQSSSVDQKDEQHINEAGYAEDCKPEKFKPDQASEDVDSTSEIFVLNNCYKSNEQSNQVTELEAKVVDKLKNGMAVYKLHKKLPNGEKQVYSDIRYYFNKVFNHLDILTPELEANYNEGMMEIIVYDNEQFLKQYGENAGFCVIENYQLVVNSLLPLLIKDNQPKEIVVYDNEGNESMLQLDSLLQAIENHNAKKQNG